MAVQDLTPQLRTRLSRLEKAVGWFVTFATLLLLAGLGYYIYKMAERKGWFVVKAPYFTYLESGAGIVPGDPVRLMGFNAGSVTRVTAESPDKGGQVYVEFVMRDPYIGYIWDDSIVRVRSAGFLGQRFLEVTKGGTRVKEDLHATYQQAPSGRITDVFSREMGAFTNWNEGDPPFWLPVDEPPELTSQMDEMAEMLKLSLTNILSLTNALTRTLTNAASATETLNDLLTAAQPTVNNLAIITENLKDPRGSLGEWLFPTNMNYQVTALLTNANVAVENANTTVTTLNTNLVAILSNTTVAIENLAAMTSNLNAQVQVNTNIVSSVSTLITDSDDFIQGLKRHWLLRSAFKDKEKKESVPRPRSPKGAGRE